MVDVLISQSNLNLIYNRRKCRVSLPLSLSAASSVVPVTASRRQCRHPAHSRRCDSGGGEVATVSGDGGIGGDDGGEG